MNRKLIALLGIVHFVTDSYPGALFAFLPAIVQFYGLSYAEAGLITTAFQATSSLAQPVFGVIVDRRDRLWLLPAGCLLAAICLSLIGVAPGYLPLLGLVVAGACGVAAFHPASWKAANRAAGVHKATGMTLHATGGNFGYAVGPLLVAPLLAGFGIAGSVYLMVPGLLTTVWVWRRLPALRSPHESAAVSERLRFGEVRQAGAPLARILGIIVLRQITHWGVVTFFPLYLVNSRGADANDVSRLLFVFLMAAAVATPLGGVFADRWGVKRLVIVTLLLQPPLIALLLQSRGFATDLLLALMGFSILLAVPLLVALAQELMPNNVGLAAGMIQGVGFGVGGVGIAALGLVADAVGLSTTLALVTVIPLPAVLLALALPSPQPRLAGPAIPDSERAR